MSVKRIYVEKKAPYAVEAKQLLWEIRHILQIKTVTGLRLLNRYDVEGVDDALYQKCLPVVFSEPQVDVTYTELPQGAKAVFAVEYLPGVLRGVHPAGGAVRPPDGSQCARVSAGRRFHGG